LQGNSSENVEWNNLDDNLLAYLKKQNCQACNKPLTELKLCYPHSAEPVSTHSFPDLNAISSYWSVVNDQRGI